MDVGLTLPTRSLTNPDDVRATLDLATRLDAAAGWSDLWVGDSLLALPFFESMTLLSALAARTERIGLGVACQATLGLRDPLLLAAQWAAADQLSGGRVTLVGCPGWGSGDAVRRELRVYGIGYVEKTRRMEVNLGLLREASATNAITLDGETYDLPTPFVQRPLPIWFAANPAEDAPAETVERLLARVARLGDGWLTYAVGAEELARRIERVRELRAELGKDEDFPVLVGINANVDADGERARADAHAAWASLGTRGVDVGELDRLGAIGDPAEVRARLEDLREAGATHVSLYPLAADQIACAERMTEHVTALTPTS